MTLVQGYGHPHMDCISEAPSELLLWVELDYKGAVSLIVDPSAGSARLSINKYIEKDLKPILKTVLDIQVLVSNEPCEKPLKTRPPDVYCDSLIWNAIIFISNMKITLPPLEPKALIVYFLLRCFFVTVSTSNGSNTSRS